MQVFILGPPHGLSFIELLLLCIGSRNSEMQSLIFNRFCSHTSGHVIMARLKLAAAELP